MLFFFPFKFDLKQEEFNLKGILLFFVTYEAFRNVGIWNRLTSNKVSN